MIFDELQMKCPNPSCWCDMRLVSQTQDAKLATFQCLQKSCKVDFVNLQIQIALTDKPNKKSIMK